MTGWLRRLRGTLGVGLTWAVTWAFAGIMIGVASRLLPWLPWERFFEVFDAPLPALAIPGFFGGVFFASVLGMAARRRRLDQLSLPQFAVWGALAGVLLSLFPVALVAIGLASAEGARLEVWESLAVVSGPFVLLSAGSAAGSLMLARRAERQDLLPAAPGELPSAGRSAPLPPSRGP
jgi:hypothetical protein